jgi:hypothetical protein
MQWTRIRIVHRLAGMSNNTYPESDTSTASDASTASAASAAAPQSAKHPHHTFFMMVRTTNEWIALTPPERFAFVDSVIRPILGRHRDVSMRFFDSEAFNARVSDVAMWETDNLMSYQAVVEELRETQFWGHYFEIVDIIAAIENAFALHYDVATV